MVDVFLRQLVVGEGEVLICSVDFLRSVAVPFNLGFQRATEPAILEERLHFLFRSLSIGVDEACRFFSRRSNRSRCLLPTDEETKYENLEKKKIQPTEVLGGTYKLHHL